MPNPVVHWQMLTSDPERSASFYGDLFEWSVSDDNALGYKTVSTGGNGIDGGFWPLPPEGYQMVQLFIQVPNISEYVTRAETLGARVIIPPQKLPDGDEMAILLDPVGFAFGITTGMKHLG
jgi:predicted enzyme related to lactoylglutathione lyase